MRAPKRPKGDFDESVRALLYRPTFKLTPTGDSPDCLKGWRSKTFEDARGNIYERERNGEWERWWLIEERKEPQGRILYAADLKNLEREEHGDCLDRKDDLAFAAFAVRGLIEDSSGRRLFFPEQLERINRMAQTLIEGILALQPAIPEPPRNRHA